MWRGAEKLLGAETNVWVLESVLKKTFSVET